MVKRFSAILASKSTYKFKIRGEKYRPGYVSHLPVRMNGWYNSIDEGGDVVEVIWEAFADITEQLNGLRKVSYFVPDTHCTVDRLWKHANATFCIQSVFLAHNMKILQLRPCKDSASCSLWCEKETSSSAASNIHSNMHSYTQHNKKQMEQCLEPDWNVADVAEQRLQGAECIGVLRRCKETYNFLSPV